MFFFAFFEVLKQIVGLRKEAAAGQAARGDGTTRLHLNDGNAATFSYSGKILCSLSLGTPARVPLF